MFGLGLSLCALVPGLVIAHGTDSHAPIVISVTDEGFVPSELTITVGETVTFENDSQYDVWPASDNHPTHEAYPAFDPKRPLLPNTAWSFTFTETGGWAMHNHLNPDQVGMIQVVPETNPNTGYASKALQPVKEAMIRIVNLVRSWFTTTATPSPENEVVVDTSFSTDFTAPQPYDPALLAEYVVDCPESDSACITNELDTVTAEYGPVAASMLLDGWLDTGVVARSVNDHQLSHKIGRTTARVFGVNPQSFALCPTDMFNGGCQHGFFEYVLGRTDSTIAAADAICASLDNSYSDKFKFYCYHGVGHGVMMQQAYDLDASLATCDSFNERSAQEGCWQGVFMENVNGKTTGYAEREGIFSDTDPLAPCNTMAAEYRQQCYVNHAGYLMQLFDNNLALGTASCLKARDWTSDCMQGLGLMVTNPSWHGFLYAENDTLDEIEIAIALCEEFPAPYQIECVRGGVSNITNFDRLDVTRADAFCAGSQAAYQDECYQQIGNNLRTSNTDTADVAAACRQLSTNGVELCLSAL